MYHIFFIHSSADGHLGCFHVLAIVNSAAMNIGVHESFRIIVLSGYIPRGGIAGEKGRVRDGGDRELLKTEMYKPVGDEANRRLTET